LGDIAEFKDIDSETSRILKRIRLGNAPLQGEKREFTSIAISEMIRGPVKDISKKIGKKIKLQIPPSVMIENPSGLVTLSEVREKLMSSFKNLCRDCRFELKDLSLPKINSKKKFVRWEIEGREMLPKGNFQQAIYVYTVSGEKHIFWISGRLKHKKLVAVAKRLISYGERIQKNDVKLEWKDMSFKRNVVVSLKNILGKKVRGFLREGQIISSHNIEREKAMRRGDVVSIEVGAGDWSIKMKAIAEEDGYVGDVIKFRNIKTKKLLSGLVIEKGKVKVE